MKSPEIPVFPAYRHVLYTITSISHVTYDTRSRTFVSIFIQQIRRDKASKSNSKNSTLFVRASYMFMDYYFIPSTGCKTFASMLSQLDNLTSYTLRNDKKYINFEIFGRSQHKLHLTNAY